MFNAVECTELQENKSIKKNIIFEAQNEGFRGQTRCVDCHASRTLFTPLAKKGLVY